MMSSWEEIPGESTGTWLSLKASDGVRSAVARSDGCIHYYRYYNGEVMHGTKHGEGEDTDYLHICDIDEEIARLQALKHIARQWFNRDRPSDAWPLEEVEGSLVAPLLALPEKVGEA